MKSAYGLSWVCNIIPVDSRHIPKLPIKTRWDVMFISQSHSNNINARMYGSSDMSVFYAVFAPSEIHIFNIYSRIAVCLIRWWIGYIYFSDLGNIIMSINKKSLEGCRFLYIIVAFLCHIISKWQWMVHPYLLLHF